MTSWVTLKIQYLSLDLTFYSGKCLVVGCGCSRHGHGGTEHLGF